MRTAIAVGLQGTDCKHRILREWKRGATVVPHGDGVLLRLPEARWMRAEEAAGEPLVRVGSVLAGVRLTSKDAVSWPVRSLVRLRGGALVAEALSDQVIAPADLIDVGEYEYVSLVALERETPAPPIAAVRGVPLCTARLADRLYAPPSLRSFCSWGQPAG